MADPQATTPPLVASPPPSNVVVLPSTSREARTQAVMDFVRENPAIAIAGGLAAGLIVGRLLPRRTRKGLAARIGKYAELATTAALAFGRNAADEASDAAGTARDAGGRAAKRAGILSSRLADSAGSAGSAAARRTGKAADIAAEAIGAFGVRAVERVGKTGRAAARRTADLGESAGEHLGDAGDAALSGFSAVLAHLGQALIGAGKRVGDASRDVGAKSSR